MAIVATDVPYTRRIILVALYTLFSFLTSGLIYGYNVLKLVLLDQQVYFSLCNPSDVISSGGATTAEGGTSTAPYCQRQILRMDDMYTVASLLTNLAGLLAGVLLDYTGPRITNTIGAVVIALGTTLFGVAPRTGIDGYLPGFIFLSIGGPIVYFSSFHLANTFPKRTGLILAFFSVGFDCSSAIYFIFEKAFFASKGQVSIERWFLFYLIVPAFEFLAGLTLMPKQVFTTQVRAPLTKPTSSSTSALPSDEKAEDVVQTEDEEQKETTVPPQCALNLHHLSLKQQLRTPQFYLMNLCLCIIVLQMNNYIGTAYNQIIAIDPTRAATLSSHFGFILPLGGLACIPAVGYLLDHQPYWLSMSLIMLFSTLYSILAMIGNMPLQYFTMVLVTMNRALMWAFSVQYFSSVFGSKSFGKVYGLVNFSMGAVNAAQRGLNAWGVSGQGTDHPFSTWQAVNGLMLALIVVTGYHMIYLTWKWEQVQLPSNIPLADIHPSISTPTEKIGASIEIVEKEKKV